MSSATFIVGVYLYNDAKSMMRYLGTTLIIAGVIFLKLGTCAPFQGDPVYSI